MIAFYFLVVDWAIAISKAQDNLSLCCLPIPESLPLQNVIFVQPDSLEHFRNAARLPWAESHINDFSLQSLHLGSQYRIHLFWRTPISQYQFYLLDRETEHDYNREKDRSIVPQVYDSNFDRKVASRSTHKSYQTMFSISSEFQTSSDILLRQFWKII